MIDGEITLNIANNGSDTGIGIGVSVYNPSNQRFGGATRFNLSVYHDALNLVGNGHLTLGPSLTNNFVTPNAVQGASSPAAIVLSNPPPVASGELIFQVQGDLQSKRAGSPHLTLNSGLIPGPPPAISYGGSAYLSVVIN